MTVTSTTARVDYLGNGVATTFAYPFRIFSPSDLRVVTRDTAGVEKVLVLGTDYTVNTSAGSITLTAVLADGYTLTIRRVLEIKQGTSFRSNGSFFPGSHEDALDRLTMVAQQQEEEIGRAMRLPESVAFAPTMPAPEPGRALVWNQTGSGLDNKLLAADATSDLPGKLLMYTDAVNENDLDKRLKRAVFQSAATDVEIIAHRGFSNSAPENTLPAFTAAAGRAHSLEFDVQCSSDGYPMAIHDNTVDRTTDGTGDVFTMTRDQLEALDAGSKFDARFAGARIPRLEDVLRVGAQSFRYVYPEIKRTRPGQQAADIATIIQAVKDAGLEERCVVQSFNWGSDFPLVRQFSRRVTLGYLVGTTGDWSTALPVAAADGNAVMLAESNMILANPGFPAAARALGVDVAVWTVDLGTDARRLAEIGVTRLMSNTLSHTWAARS